MGFVRQISLQNDVFIYLLFFCNTPKTYLQFTTIYITIYGFYGVVKLLGSSPGTAMHL